MEKKKTKIGSATTILALVIAASLMLAPLVMSAPGKDKGPDINKGPGKETALKGKTDNPETILKNDTDKKKPSPKKKAVKKVGTAAAVGIAGNKVKSGLGDGFGKDKE